MKYHRLTLINKENRSAFCLICGNIDISSTGSGWRCGNQERLKNNSKKFNKICSDCGEIRDGGSKTYCSKCMRRRQWILQGKNPDICEEQYWLKKTPAWRKRQKKEYNLISNYGITIHEYELLLIQQNNRCLICDLSLFEGTRPVVDHDHLTAEVRGILHSSCNLGIGLLGENLDNLQRAIRYLEEK